MKRIKMFLSVLLVVLAIGITGCKTNKPDAKYLEKEISKYLEKCDLSKDKVYNSDFIIPKPTFEKGKEYEVKWEVDSSEMQITTNSEGNYVFKIITTDEKNVTVKLIFEFNDIKQEKEVIIKVAKKVESMIAKFGKMPENAEFTIEGKVVAVAKKNEKGYYISDGTAVAFVYESHDEIKVGDVLSIKGKKTKFHSMMQIVYQAGQTPVKKDTVIKDLKATTMTPKDIYGLNPNEFYFKKIKLKGIVEMRKVDFMTNIYIRDIVTKQEVQIYYRSLEDGLPNGKYVELDCYTYSYHDQKDLWYVFRSSHEAGFKEIKDELSDNERIEAVKKAITEKYEGKTFYSAVDEFIPDPFINANVKFTSLNTDILSDSFEVVKKDEGQYPIKMKAEITTPSGKKEEIQISFELKNLKTQNIIDIIKAYDANPSNDKVSFEGVVTGSRGTSGFFIADDTASLYVYRNYSNYDVKDKVKIIGYLKIKSGQLTVYTDNVIKTGVSDKDITAVSLTADNIYASEKPNEIMNQYVKLTGTLNAKAGQYGASYTLVSKDKSFAIHAASNTSGFKAISGNEVTLYCYLQGYKSDTWKIFTTNLPGQLEVNLASDKQQDIGIDYLKQIMADKDSKLNRNIILPSHPIGLDFIKYDWTSSDKALLSDKGEYLNNLSGGKVTLTAKVTSANDNYASSKNITFEYNIEKYNQDQKEADLYIKSLMHGAKYNKMYTIVNPTNKDIDLSQYSIYSIQNTGIGSNTFDKKGDNAQGVLKLSGTIKSGGAIALYHASMDKVIVDQIPSDVQKIPCPNQKGVVAFNGKDGDLVYLMKGSVIIDKIGSYEKTKSMGQRTSWEKIFFVGKMLIRKENSITNPALNWSEQTSVSKLWDVNPSPSAPEYKLPSVIFNK